MSSEVQGRELLDFIEQLGELEWARFESRYPTIKIKGGQPITENRSNRPPYTSFRFVHEDADVLERLKKAVESYRGDIEWTMEGHQRASFPNTTNWVICPKIMADIRQPASDLNLTSSQYMVEKDPEFGPRAYEDFLKLVENLRKAFGK